MDECLLSLGLIKKHVPKDSICLFRAVAEQVYFSQSYHKRVREKVTLFIENNEAKFKSIIGDMDVENHIKMLRETASWGTQIDMVAISLIYKKDIMVYLTSDKMPIKMTNNFNDEYITLCTINWNHYDCVYPQSYFKKSAFIQSILYEILYKGVFGIYFEFDKQFENQLDTNNNEAVNYSEKVKVSSNDSTSNGLEEQYEKYTESSSPEYNKMQRKFKYDTYSYKANRRENMLKKLAKNIPISLKILKSLDVYIFRNVAHDAWFEAKKDEQKINLSAVVNYQYAPGDICLVKLTKSDFSSDSNNGDCNNHFYNAHIQNIKSGNREVVVFVEDLGQKFEVKVEQLYPFPGHMGILSPNNIYGKFGGKIQSNFFNEVSFNPHKQNHKKLNKKSRVKHDGINQDIFLNNGTNCMETSNVKLLNERRYSADQSYEQHEIHFPPNPNKILFKKNHDKGIFSTENYIEEFSHQSNSQNNQNEMYPLELQEKMIKESGLKDYNDDNQLLTNDNYYLTHKSFPNYCRGESDKLIENNNNHNPYPTHHHIIHDKDSKIIPISDNHHHLIDPSPYYLHPISFQDYASSINKIYPSHTKPFNPNLEISVRNSQNNPTNNCGGTNKEMLQKQVFKNEVLKQNSNIVTESACGDLMTRSNALHHNSQHHHQAIFPPYNIIPPPPPIYFSPHHHHHMIPNAAPPHYNFQPIKPSAATGLLNNIYHHGNNSMVGPNHNPQQQQQQQHSVQQSPIVITGSDEVGTSTSVVNTNYDIYAGGDQRNMNKAVDQVLININGMYHPPTLPLELYQPPQPPPVLPLPPPGTTWVPLIFVTTNTPENMAAAPPFDPTSMMMFKVDHTGLAATAGERNCEADAKLKNTYGHLQQSPTVSHQSPFVSSAMPSKDTSSMHNTTTTCVNQQLSNMSIQDSENITFINTSENQGIDAKLDIPNDLMCSNSICITQEPTIDIRSEPNHVFIKHENCNMGRPNNCDQQLYHLGSSYQASKVKKKKRLNYYKDDLIIQGNHPKNDENDIAMFTNEGWKENYVHGKINCNMYECENYPNGIIYKGNKK